MKIHSRCLLLACLAALPAATLHAQTDQWTGGGGTASLGWSDPTNWTNGAPANGESLVFSSSQRTGYTATSDNFASLTINSITSPAGANPYITYLVSGTSTGPGALLTVNGTGISNDSSNAPLDFVVSANPAANQGGALVFAGTATVSSNVELATQGAGLTNGTGGVGGLMEFTANSSAGSANITNTPATTLPSQVANAPAAFGSTRFTNGSSAGNAIIYNNGAAANNTEGSLTGFYNNSTAKSATITNLGGMASGAGAGVTVFVDSATAAGATINNRGGIASGAFGGFTDFENSATAGNATIILYGGEVSGARAGTLAFVGASDGGTAKVGFVAGGTLDISGLNSSGMNLGSIVGDATYVNSTGQTVTGAGLIDLGRENLSVGGNNQDTTYNGSIVDGGTYGGTGGSLTKTGTGILSLTGASTYTGGTVVSGGVLSANNTTGSATGTGAVAVQSGGTLGGSGTVAGNVGVASGGFLSPGVATGNGGLAGALTVGGNIGLAPNGTLVTVITGTTAGTGYGQVKFGGTLTLGGTLGVFPINGFTLTPGMTFTILEGTGTGLVTGTFSNTTAGGTIYADSYGDTFLVNYAANTDGGLVANDVTLTVLGATAVPEPGTWALVVVFGTGALVVAATRRVRRA